MKALRANIPVILFILFELAVGILLLVDGDALTTTVLICFGIILMVIGAVYLIRFLRERGAGKANYLTLIMSVLSLFVGAVCVIFPGFVKGLFTVIAIIYGVILIVMGVYKTKTYNDAKSEGASPSFLTLISAVLSLVLGVVVIVNPFKADGALYVFAGISLIFEAALDFAAVVVSFGKTEQKALVKKDD